MSASPVHGSGGGPCLPPPMAIGARAVLGRQVVDDGFVLHRALGRLPAHGGVEHAQDLLARRRMRSAALAQLGQRRVEAQLALALDEARRHRLVLHVREEQRHAAGEEGERAEPGQHFGAQRQRRANLFRRGAMARGDVHEKRTNRRAVPERFVERGADGDDDGGAAHERGVLQIHAEEHDALHDQRELGDQPEGDLGERELVRDRLRGAIGGERARIVAQRLIGGARRQRGVEVAIDGARHGAQISEPRAGERSDGQRIERLEPDVLLEVDGDEEVGEGGDAEDAAGAGGECRREQALAIGVGEDAQRVEIGQQRGARALEDAFVGERAEDGDAERVRGGDGDDGEDGGARKGGAMVEHERDGGGADGPERDAQGERAARIGADDGVGVVARRRVERFAGEAAAAGARERRAPDARDDEPGGEREREDDGEERRQEGALGRIEIEEDDERDEDDRELGEEQQDVGDEQAPREAQRDGVGRGGHCAASIAPSRSAGALPALRNGGGARRAEGGGDTGTHPSAALKRGRGAVIPWWAERSR